MISRLVIPFFFHLSDKGYRIFKSNIFIFLIIGIIFSVFKITDIIRRNLYINRRKCCINHRKESLNQRLELPSVAIWRRYFNLNIPALIATITVLRLINTAPAAGLKRIPCLYNTPAASGRAIILYPVAQTRF